jgi:transposase/uncharacterized coiled-coil protein SlyX
MANVAPSLDAPLPSDVALCHTLIRELLATVHEQQRRITHLEHQLDGLLKRLYGPRADRLHPQQGTLFGEPPPEPPPTAGSSEEPPPARSAKSNRGHGRRTIPPDLPRVCEVVDISDAEKLATGGEWVRIGEVVSEQLEFTPSSLFVRQIVRPKYAVRFDTSAEPNSGVPLRVAELPVQAMPRCLAAPGLVADVIVSKLVDHLPLYRQQQRYARQGVTLSRSTLCDWMRDAADVLRPLWQVLRDRMLAAGVVHTDDTPIPVQDSDRDHCRTGRLWTYTSTTGTVYDATATRSRDGPLQFLQGFHGYLQCDAYAGYDELVRTSRGTITTVGCWAHVRRKFVDAQQASPREAHEAVARIRQLYAIEHTAKELTSVERATMRQRDAVPVLTAFATWLEEQRAKAIPRTPLAEAIGYAVNQWSSLIVYVQDGRLAIDNNTAERAIKPFAIGRKNWLFFGSDRGGRTLATLASFTATCQQCGVNPWMWLRDTLTRLPQTPADQLATLLPTPSV